MPIRCSLEHPHLRTQKTWRDQVGIFPAGPRLRRDWGPQNPRGEVSKQALPQWRRQRSVAPWSRARNSTLSGELSLSRCLAGLLVDWRLPVERSPTALALRGQCSAATALAAGSLKPPQPEGGLVHPQGGPFCRARPRALPGAAEALAMMPAAATPGCIPGRAPHWRRIEWSRAVGVQVARWVLGAPDWCDFIQPCPDLPDFWRRRA